MKLVRYEKEYQVYFGFVREEELLSFSDLTDEPMLASIESYLENLPQSRVKAEEIRVASQEKKGTPLSEVRLLPIMKRPTALIDFGLTPKHMHQSAKMLITKEMRGLKRFLALKIIKKRVDKAMNSSNYAYYKGNHCAVSGEGDTVVWPSYTAYLDIEPELACVYGNSEEPIAGYCILNDLSARDVQVPELNDLSLTRSKDFDNGLSSFLVTPDEVGDPLSLSVSVKIGTREEWSGDTTNYSVTPIEAINYLNDIAPLATGTLVGFGTVPNCCGLERDTWIRPGDSVTIEFEKLGSLTQKIPTEVTLPKECRWDVRGDLSL